MIMIYKYPCSHVLITVYENHHHPVSKLIAIYYYYIYVYVIGIIHTRDKLEVKKILYNNYLKEIFKRQIYIYIHILHIKK